ncbi:MAG TPA: DUF6263 family protein [Thermoguttaceae bacterium]
MKTNLPKCFVFVVAVLLVGGAAARAATLLRNKFPLGEAYHYTMNQDQVMIIHVPGQDITQNVTQNMIIDMTTKVEAVDAKGNASLTLLMDRVRMKVDTPQGVIIDYDTASQEKPKGLAKMIALIFEPMTKKPFKMKQSPLGKISDVKMPEGLNEALKKASTAAAQVGGTIPSEEDLSDNMKVGGFIFPDEPVSEGKTWTIENIKNFEGAGKKKVKTTYRYAGKENKDGKDLDKISVTEALKSPGDNKNSDLKSMSTAGTIYFDNTAGIMVEQNLNSKMKIEKTTNGTQVSIDVNVANTTKLVSVDSTK